MNSESLFSQKGSPAGFENVVPALGGVSGVGGDNCDSPTKVMGGIHPRCDGLVHVLGVEPSRELLIFRHTTFEAPGEAQQGVSAIGAAGGGEGLVVVHFPKQK